MVVFTLLRYSLPLYKSSFVLKVQYRGSSSLSAKVFYQVYEKSQVLHISIEVVYYALQREGL